MKTLRAHNITKTYQMGNNEVQALRGISLEVDKGEFLAITGFSGSGKSTLMHILGCLDISSGGEYLIDDISVGESTRDELAQIRNKKIGFVFQKFYLLPDLTACDNVCLPQLYAGIPEAEARKFALELLDMVELSNRSDHYPYQLSGGQQQRVAIARSLSNRPSIILADEPTGNLDLETGNTIMDIFRELNQKHQTTIIIVTHEPVIAQKTNRIIELIDGTIKSDKKVTKRTTKKASESLEEKSINAFKKQQREKSEASEKKSRAKSPSKKAKSDDDDEGINGNKEELKKKVAKTLKKVAKKRE